MAKWYGEQTLADMTDKGYVVDHMNNNGLDCRISNLEFLRKAYNTAKGQTFDIDSEDLRFRIAVNIFKDFATGCYQITIACNDTVCGFNYDGSKYYITDIKLLYDCDYSIVINDAENILRQYETEGKISLARTHACESRVTKAVDIQLTEEEKKSASVVIRDGNLYLVLGTGHAYIISSCYDKMWSPPETKG